MFQNIKKIVSQNLSAILFFGLIVFAGLSLWFNSQSAANGAKELVEYADKSAPLIRNQFTDISNKTLLAENKPESYQTTLNDLDKLTKTLQELRSGIPRKTSDTESVQLQNGLSDFYSTIELNVRRIRERVVAQSGLYEPYLTFGKLRSLSEQGDVKTLESVTQAGRKILDFDSQQVNQISEPSIKASRQKSIDAEKSRLEELQKITQEQDPNRQLTEVEKNQIIQLYSQQWPLTNPSFPRINRDEFENQTFAQDIQTLQTYISNLKKRYNI